MNWFTIFVYCWMAVAVITLISLVILKIRAPYGRHANDKWGKMIPNKAGWIIMEFPALLITPILFLVGPAEKDWFAWLLVGLWVLHYFNRTVIFPFRIKTKGKMMPLTIVYSALFFNGINGFVNGFFLGFLYEPELFRSFFDMNILIGLLVFFVGMGINHMADSKLIALRKEGMGYQIPRGWLFEYVSCPNHFGEIVEWTGYAIIGWNLPALSFAVWTFANLVPRTLNHHEWYSEKFEDYPQNRKAVIPYLW